MQRFALSLGVSVVALALAASLTRADDKPPKGGLSEVGKTKDACSRGNVVKFNVSGGRTAMVGAGESKLFELEDVTKEITWYCGDSRERCANDANFNWVRCERAGNGAITWTFYRKK